MVSRQPPWTLGRRIVRSIVVWFCRSGSISVLGLTLSEQRFEGLSNFLSAIAGRWAFDGLSTLVVDSPTRPAKCGEMETDEAGFHFDGVDGHQDCFHEMGGRRPGARPYLGTLANCLCKTALVQEWFLEDCPERVMMLAGCYRPIDYRAKGRGVDLVSFPELVINCKP